MSISVLLVDDDPLVRAGLAMILQGDEQIKLLGEGSDGQSAITLTTELRPDVILMDIRMPILDGLAATEHIMRLPDPPRIIILTTFDSDDYVMRALASGAAGFLLKDTPPAQIVEAIGKVAAGEPMLSPTVTEQLIDFVTKAPASAPQASTKVASLTARELEVAVAIGQGASNAEISRDLFMSLATVKAHISHIFDKLGVNNRVQVAVLMHSEGML